MPHLKGSCAHRQAWAAGVHVEHYGLLQALPVQGHLQQGSRVWASDSQQPADADEGAQRSAMLCWLLTLQLALHLLSADTDRPSYNACIKRKEHC